MASIANNPAITRLSAEALDLHRLVKQNADGDVVHATATGTDEAIGVTTEAVADDTLVGVRLPTAGTLKCTAVAAIARNAIVVQAAAGKIQTATGLVAGTYRRVGTALEAATADLDVIEVAPVAFGTLHVVA